MQIIGWLVFGLVVGMLAKGLAHIFIPGKESSGCLTTSILGIVGSMVGGFVGKFFFGGQYTAGWIGSILGTFLLLVIFHMIKARD